MNVKSLNKYDNCMMFLKRVYNSIVNHYHLWHFVRNAKRCGVELTLGKGIYIRNCHIWAHEKTSFHKLVIGDNCALKYVSFGFPGSQNSICLRERTKINAWNASKTSFHAGDNTSIIVGRDCLLANGIIMSSTDYHKIYDSNGNQLNDNSDVVLGNHVWVGQRAYLAKGARIVNNSVIGACSVVTKQFNQENIIIAGNPAKIVKENINWVS